MPLQADLPVLNNVCWDQSSSPHQQPRPGLLREGPPAFHFHDGTASGFLASIHFIPHFSKQRTFCSPGHQAACRTVLSSARSRKSLFPVLQCLSKPVNVKPRRRYNLPYTNRGPTSTIAAHLTTFFIQTSAPSSQPRSLKPNSLLAPRVSRL